MPLMTPVASEKLTARAQQSSDCGPRGGVSSEMRATMALVLAGRRWRALLDDKLRPISQSSARMETLGAIKHSPQLSPQVEIAKRLRIEGPTLTRMLDTLEADGLVQRLADPVDRRSKLLKLTPAGERALEQMIEISDRNRAALLDGIPPEDVEKLKELCLELVCRLDRGLPDCD